MPPDEAPEPWLVAQEFLAGWQRRCCFAGALVCGSYVTGHPTPRSDVDIVIVLAQGTRWRERGNRVIDGLLVEYFANSAKQIRSYWTEDRAVYSRVNSVMLLTGRILADPGGEVAELVADAKRWFRKPLPKQDRAAVVASQYGLWDMVDNTLDAAEQDAPDFPFQYYHTVRGIYAAYARYLRQPVMQPDRILQSYRAGGHPEKYLLEPFPDPPFMRMLLRAMIEPDPARMPRRLRQLAKHVQEAMGGFELDGFRLRTPSV